MGRSTVALSAFRRCSLPWTLIEKPSDQRTTPASFDAATVSALRFFDSGVSSGQSHAASADMQARNVHAARAPRQRGTMRGERRRSLSASLFLRRF
jgi:hypothetical protein